MIDWKKSAELNGCSIDNLRKRFERFPKSHKKVWRICEGEGCNDESKVEFRVCTNLCKKCVNTIKNKSLGMREKVSKSATERWSDPAERKAARKRTTDFFIAHPEDLAAMLKRSRDYWKNQDNCDRLSETMRNSDAHKALSDKMRGGNDIVNHHYIYDHDNPDQHTIEITRSQHQAHHHWMKRNKLEVPHLNVTEKNKDIFKRRS